MDHSFQDIVIYRKLYDYIQNILYMFIYIVLTIDISSSFSRRIFIILLALLRFFMFVDLL
jgi:hypothetical protein